MLLIQRLKEWGIFLKKASGWIISWLTLQILIRVNRKMYRQITKAASKSARIYLTIPDDEDYIYTYTTWNCLVTRLKNFSYDLGKVAYQGEKAPNTKVLSLDGKSTYNIY